MPPTEEELGWARAIKCAALAKELEPVSDMLYLQMAVVSKAKVKKAVKRLEKLQEFRRKYNIIDAETDDAVALLRGSYALFPGFLGAIGRDSEGRAVLVSHVSKYLPAKLEPDEWRTMLVAGYYMFNAFNADVEEVRKGVVFVTDCRGMGWKNFSLVRYRETRDLLTR